MAANQQMLFSGGGGNDSFTKILLHFDGADASTTFTDSNLGGAAHTWTAAGNAQLDTGIAPKFGTAAGLFDGTGDYISTPDHANFTLGSGPWTVDFWFNISGGAGTARRICGQLSAAAAENSFGATLLASNVINYSTNDGTSNFSVTGTTAITTPGWHHYAAVRTGNTLKLFLDGVQEGGDTAMTNPTLDSTASWSIGRLGDLVQGDVGLWQGSIDEFRLSVGIARWTTNFTPPNAPYI